MSVREKITIGIGAPLWILIQIGGILIHVWTIILAYAFSGLFAAAITFCMPVISELYWFVKIGSRYGFNHQYCIIIMGFIGVSIFVFLLASWGSKDIK